MYTTKFKIMSQVPQESGPKMIVPPSNRFKNAAIDQHICGLGKLIKSHRLCVPIKMFFYSFFFTLLFCSLLPCKWFQQVPTCLPRANLVGICVGVSKSGIFFFPNIKLVAFCDMIHNICWSLVQYFMFPCTQVQYYD